MDSVRSWTGHTESLIEEDRVILHASAGYTTTRISLAMSGYCRMLSHPARLRARAELRIQSIHLIDDRRLQYDQHLSGWWLTVKTDYSCIM